MSRGPDEASLQRAARDEELVAELPAVVALGFGVLALRREDGRLELACFEHANRDALRRLRDVLECEVVASPGDDRALQRALRVAYPADEVNFPTFHRPDFLEDPTLAAVLRREKVEPVPQGSCSLPPEQLLLADLTFHTRLEDLDRAARGQALPRSGRTRFELGELALAWGGAQPERLFLPPSDEVGPSGLPGGTAAAVANFYRFNEYRQLPGGGRLHKHRLERVVLASLPWVIHPTELQLTQIGADGSLEVYADGQLSDVAPGAGEQVIRGGYWFLSYGHRMRRTFALTVHDLRVAERSGLAAAPLAQREGGAPWSGAALGRWFGNTAAHAV